MSTEPSQQFLSEASPSVQIHLGFLQAVIQRMAGNSAACKGWCIAIVSAILVLVADKGRSDYAFLALIPTMLFLALDAYYLALEKAYRTSYNDFLKKLHSSAVKPEDLYTVAPEGNRSMHQFRALRSFSVWGFYVTLGVLIELARSVVLN